jgi:hypothetical protein
LRCAFMEQNVRGVFCDSYNCKNIATLRIGNPEGPPQLFMQLCRDCAISLVESGEAMGLKAETFVCEHCGKEFDNEKSRKMHAIRCSKRKEEGGDE